MHHTTDRLVLNFPGFETTTAVHQIERLGAGGHKTASLWNFGLTCGPIRDDTQTRKTVCHFTARSENWSANVRYVHFSWADIISKYEDVPYPRSLFGHFPAYLAFFFDGSVWSYFKASARYWGFTLYPLMLMVVFAIVAWFLAGMALSALSYSGFTVQLLVTLALTLVLTKIPGDRFYVSLSINDWAFARDMCLSRNPEINARYDLFAKEIVQEIRQSKAHEIVLVGHSFGAVWAIMALAGALETKPDLFKGRDVAFLALGSSLLKIGLVKGAEFLRIAIRRVLREKSLLWHEIQAKTDFVSFYKSDPFSPMNIEDVACETIVHRVNFRKALSGKRYRKMMKSMYLAHRQYILYCDNRVHHDYQLRVFGPCPAAALARDTMLAIENPLFKPETEPHEFRS